MAEMSRRSQHFVSLDYVASVVSLLDFCTVTTRRLSTRVFFRGECSLISGLTENV
jgi:hypothetical protein